VDAVRWIPIDQVPEQSGEYLTRVYANKVFIFTQVFDTEKGWWMLDSDTTHWMPIPEPTNHAGES